MPSMTHTIRPIACAVALAFCAPAVLAQAPRAPSATQAMAIDIPAQPVAQGLQKFVDVTRFQLLYAPDIVRGVTSKAVSGTLTPREALGRLLEGTGLEIVDTGPTSATIRPMSGTAQSNADQVVAASGVSPQTVVVSGVSHLASQSRTGTRSDEDPMALPMSVSTVDKKLLNQQQALTLADAVSNVAGVQTFSETGELTIRGFYANVQKNGSNTNSRQFFDAPLISIDKIEVVKGPAAIVAGVTARQGGVVNLITKTPQLEPVTQFAGTVGSRGYYEFGLDIGRPLNDDKSVLARLVLSKQDSRKTLAGYDGASRDFVSPSLTWRNKSTGTEVTAQYEYQKSRAQTPLYYFEPTTRTTLDDSVKPFRFLDFGLGAPSDGNEGTTDTTNIQVTQRIAKGWTLGLRYQRQSQDYLSLGAINFGTYPFVQSPIGENRVKYTVNDAKLEINGRFDLGPISHHLLVAFDDIRTNSDTTARALKYFFTDVSSGQPQDVSAFLGLPTTTKRAFGSTETGVLLMDHVTWNDWVALVGWRQVAYTNTGVFAVPGASEFSRGLPSLGVLYKVNPALSLYVSSAKTFLPHNGLLGRGSVSILPEDAKQLELGFKSLFNGGRLGLTVAAFRIEQLNVAIIDPTDTTFNQCNGTPCYVNVASGVKSQGAEFELSGELMPRLSARAAYTYMDKRSGDPLIDIGLAYARHLGSVWLNYRFGDVADRGWWIGAGLQARSSRIPVTTRFFPNNPSQTRWDLNGGYQARDWSIVAGVKNLADNRLFPIGALTSGAILQPREYYATVRYDF